MTRRCSHCSHNGHNSRTCPSRTGGGVRLFGVTLTDGGVAMKKSASMSCIAMDDSDHACAADVAGYASDDPNPNSRGERKRGIAWTEEEHRKFLQGLQKLGKGDWRGIARKYVVSRTPTQVASHAQKYFIRQTNATRRKRRISLFDMVPENPNDQVQIQEESFLPHSLPNELEKTNQLPPLQLGQPEVPEIVESSSSTHTPEACQTTPYNSSTPITIIPTFFPAFIPVPMPLWPASMMTTAQGEATREFRNILKPTPLFPKELLKMDEVVTMSKLSIGEVNAGRLAPSTLSLKLHGGSSSRPSAFHIAPSVTGADLNQGNGSPIHAV